jgi:hypothetical protein
MAYKTDIAGNIIKNEHNQPIEDAVNTLIFAITKHFVGDPSVYRENIYDSLEHLKCHTLTDFRWYKDVFLSRVLIRTDNRALYWKEKFIGGLPKYFAHKVREKLNNDGHNDYTNLTYGEIINAIKHIGLNLCNDIRLTNQLKKDMKYAKQELGSFCEQYGFPPLIAPSTKHKHKKYNHKKMKSYKSYKKYYESKNSKSFRPNKFKHNKKQPVCYKCGQTGHYKNNCKVKDKIKELNIDDKLKSQLLNILSESDTESEELLQIDDKNTTSQDDEYSDSSEENEIGFCFCKYKNMCTCRKEINTLTREERIILELIDQIEDPETKIKYLSQISQKEKIITNDINYNFTDVSNRF